MKGLRWIAGGLGAVACVLPRVELFDSTDSGGGGSGGKSGNGGSAMSGGTAGDSAGETSSGGSSGKGGMTGTGGSGGDGGEGGAEGGVAGTSMGGESGEAGMGGTQAGRGGMGGRATGGAGGAMAGAGGVMGGAGAGGTPGGAGGATGGAGTGGAGGAMGGAGAGGAGGAMGGAGGAGAGGGGAGAAGGVAGACTFPTAQSAWPDSPTIFCSDGSIAGTCPSSSQTAYGQDANYVRTLNTYSLANGVVSDALLGLEWRRGFPSTPLTFGGASDHCEGLMFDGKDDWRLPNRIELVSLVDFGRYDPVLDTTFFDVPTGTYRGFWSRTGHASLGQNHWIVTSDDGNVIPRANLLVTQVRCVRGPALMLVKSELAGCSIIFDSFTGLGFQKFPSGQTFGWTGALSHCENLEQDGFFDWRLPSVKELLTIVDATVVNPAIDATFFPGTPVERFWTSTPFVNNPANAWVVDFADGSAAHDRPTSAPHRVRCVRGG